MAQRHNLGCSFPLPLFLRLRGRVRGPSEITVRNLKDSQSFGSIHVYDLFAILEHARYFFFGKALPHFIQKFTFNNAVFAVIAILSHQQKIARYSLAGEPINRFHAHCFTSSGEHE